VRVSAPDTGTLAGRVAIVTGAGQGGGRGVALALAARGVTTMLFGRTAAKLEAVAAEIAGRGGHALAMTGDVGDDADRRRLVAETVGRLGGVDILVNTALSPEQREQRVADATAALTDELWRTGFVATQELMRLCHPHMRDAGCGSIVNFGSAAEHFPHGYGVYAAVKAAVTTMSRAAALEWGRDNVRVNVVLPFVRSPANDAFEASSPAEAAIAHARVPLGRVGDPELDIGRPVAFLAGPDSSFITGTVLGLNGGSAFVR
jgi:NAD(P)-dependent dehydrogenase (short-subunit alcohol dehydrogenase family)